MAPTDEPAYRTRTSVAGDEISVREGEAVDDEDGVFEIRMPIASTGEVRNQGDDPLTRAELEGFARQINERAVGVFLGHGSDSTIANGHYSALERLGDWRDGEFVARSEDGDDGVLMATARMPDPEALPQTTGSYREGLAILKEQAKAGIAQDASIGWRTDDTFPGGNDLMEASIVGIGADWRTNTDDEQAEVVARAAVAAGADRDALVREVRAAVTRNLDDPAYSEGDAVAWDWQGDTVHGRVADDPAESVTVDGQEITGDEGEAVYPIHEYDEEVEAFRERNVAKPESSLSASDRDLPPANEENFQGMTDDDSGDDPGTTEQEQTADDGETRAPDDLTEERLATFTAVHYDGFDESDVMSAADAADAEFVGAADVEELYDLVSVVVGAEYDAVESAMEDLAGGENEGDKPDDYDDDEGDDEEQDAEPDAEQEADDERDAAVDELRSELEAMSEELDDLRSKTLTGDDVETPETEGEREADEEPTDDNGDETPAEIRVSDL